MNLVFVYEDKIAQDAEGNYYTGSAFSQAVFDRYLQHFDHLTLLMRKAKIDPTDREALSRMNKLDSTNLDVVILPDFTDGIRNFFSRKIRKDFKKTIIENTKANAVIVRAPSTSGYIAAKECKKQQKPFLVEAVGCPWDSLWNHSIKGKVLAPVEWLKFRRTMAMAPYAVYVTSEFLQHRYPTKGKQAAISDVELQPMEDRILEQRLAKIETKEGTYKLGTAGALQVAYKGQRFVIEALAKLKAQGITNFEYHLAGGGDNTALKELAKTLKVEDQVIFEGVLPHDEMFAWLDEMDVYLQPSTVESMPRALIEAMSRGLPAFATRVGGMTELLGMDCIFEKGEVDKIADNLVSLNPEKMKAMAKKNFNRAKTFQKDRLEKERYAFYAAFAKDAKGESK